MPQHTFEKRSVRPTRSIFEYSEEVLKLISDNIFI